MLRVSLPKKVSDEDAKKLEGVFIGDDSYDTVISDSVHIREKETGEPLGIFIKDAIPQSLVEQGYEALKVFAKNDSNRGVAAGKIDRSKIRKDHQKLKLEIKGSRYSPILADGTKSRVSYSNMSNSGIFGYFEDTPRFPYCRQTALTMSHLDQYRGSLPYIQAVNNLFKQYLPERYIHQEEQARQSPKDFIIEGTVFSTLTVNKNFRTAVHTDKGDLHEGFSCLAVARRRNYTGCYTVVPQWRVAFDVHEGDLLLMNAHNWHGNSPMYITDPKVAEERLAVVFYYRTNIVRCGTLEEERRKAQLKADQKALKDRAL